VDEVLRVQFDGGIASAGRLHFYEYSRAEYALARFVITIEHFRRTEEVVEKIGSRSYVDLFVASPERGSFIQDIVVNVIGSGASVIISVPLAALMSYVWHRLAPRQTRTDEILVEIAQLRLAEARQRTIQERERTAQLRIYQSILEDERAPAKDAETIVGEALEGYETLRGSLAVPERDLTAALDELGAEAERERQFEKYKEALEKIDETTFNRLTSRLRPSIKDISLPLRKSATRMSIGDARAKRTFMYMDLAIAEAIQHRRLEEEVVEIEGRVKSYDRDSGAGKFKSPEFPRVLNFIVPISEKARLRDSILSAMRRDRVVLKCRRQVDDSGMPTSIILLDVEQT
jgi:hypothetical protein